MVRTLPHTQNFATADTIDTWWNNSTNVGLLDISGTKYVAGNDSIATTGNIGFEMSGLKATYSPTTYETYTIKIVAGPGGFAPADKIHFSMLIEICDAAGGEFLSTNTISILATDSGFTVTQLGVDQFITMYNIVGQALTVTLTSNGDNTTTVLLCLWDDADLTTLNSTSSGIATYGDTWTTTTPHITVGKTGDFLVAELSVFLGSACIAEGSLIETIAGLKPVEQLTEYDYIFDDRGTPTPVVKVWKSVIPTTQNCVRIGPLIVTTKHKLRRDDTWETADAVEGTSFLHRAYFYQIQTDSYGFRSGDYSLATWTQHYIDTHPFDGYI